MGVWAIDVSVHQGPIDWAAVKASGVRAVWVKVGGADGGYYRDSKAGANLAGAEAQGIPLGTYYFCSPAPGNAVDQARHAVTCGHGRGMLWPAADLETNPRGMSNEQLDVWLAEFCAEVMRLTGRESIWYGGMSGADGKTFVGRTTRAPHCPCWIANYGANRPGTTPPNFSPQVPPAWDGWDIWQFNSETRLPGIPANTVDQNVITDAFWARMTNAAPAAPKPKEDDEMLTIYWTAPGSGWVADEAHLDNTISQGFRVEGAFAKYIGEKARPGHEGWDPRTDAVRSLLALQGFGDGQREANVPDSVMRTLCLLPDALTATSATVDVGAIVNGLRQPVTDTITAVLASRGVDVNEGALADAVAAELAERLQG